MEVLVCFRHGFFLTSQWRKKTIFFRFTGHSGKSKHLCTILPQKNGPEAGKYFHVPSRSIPAILLPCQYGSIAIVQKVDFEIRPDLGCTTLKTSRKVVLDNPSVCLSLFPRALTCVRVNRSSWNFSGMFGYMGRCAVLIFEAIRKPVYKIILSTGFGYGVRKLE